MAFNGYLIAEAYATLGIDDKKFTSGLVGAGIKWDAFTKKMNSALNFGPMNTGLANFRSSLIKTTGRADNLAKSLENVAKQAQAVNKAMGQGTMKALTAHIRAMGKAYADAFKGIGSGIASIVKGFGTAFGSIFAGFGKGIGNTGNMFKGIGQGISSIVRGLGSGISSIIRSSGSAANSTLRGMSSLVGGMTRSLSTVIGSFKGLAIGGLLAGAIGGYGAKELISNSANMELSFARVRRAAEFTDNEFGVFRKDLLDFGNVANGVKLDNLFEIATVGAKIGVSGDQLNLFTRDMAKVRVAISEADLPTEEMAERIGSLISVFHRGNDEAIKFASALNALDLKSVASAREILDVSGRMSGTASLLGMKPQEVLALSTALRQAKVPVETAGTAMQQIMGRMASRKDSPQFARIVGMKEKPFLKLVGADPLKAIIKIEEGLQRLDKITAIRALDQLGLDGQRVRGTLLQLGTVLPQLNDYVRLSEREWKTLGSIMESNAIIGETLHGQWEKVRTNFATTADALGKHLLPIFKELASALENLMFDIRGSLEANKGAFRDWADWIGERVSYIGVIWRNWGNIVELGRLKFEAAMTAMGRITANFGSALMKNLGWAAGASFQILINGLSELLPTMIDLGKRIGIAIGGGIKDGIAGLLLGGGGNGPLAGPAAGFAERMMSGVAPAPGFKGVMSAAPKTPKELKENLENLGKQGVQHRVLDNAVFNQAAQRNQRVAAMEAKDADVRRQAEVMRAPHVAPGPPKRRPVDISVLRPGPNAVDFGANMARAKILGGNVAIPNVAMPRDRSGIVGPDRGVLGGIELNARRQRMSVPLALRDTHVNPANRDFVGPLPAEAEPGVRRAIGTFGGGRIGRGAQAANRQFKEWRRQENLRMRGRVDLRDSGDGALRGPGIKVQDKEKGIEEVLTENKLQTKELTEIRTALNEIKARPAMTV